MDFSKIIENIDKGIENGKKRAAAKSVLAECIEVRGIEFVWGRIASINNTFVFGKSVDDQNELEVIASVTRHKDGTWSWVLHGSDHQGNEPSREDAMNEVEKYVNEAVL